MWIQRYLWLGMMVLSLVACQGDGGTVEVTREVEVTRLVTAPVTPEYIPVEVVQEVIVEVTRVVGDEADEEMAAVGGEERPLQFWSAPSSGLEIETKSDLVAEALKDVTGYEVEVMVPESDEGVLAAMCDEPQRAVGILPAAVYAFSEQLCSNYPVMTVKRYEQAWQIGMILVPMGSDYTSVADLDGKVWGVPERDNLATYYYFKALWKSLGIEPAEEVILGDDSSAVLAVLNGEVDFATATYIPPILPYFERDWVLGVDTPEMWRGYAGGGYTPQRSPIGYVLLAGEPRHGGFRIRDARARVFDIAPTIFAETRILELGEPIPNDIIVWGGGLSLEVATTLSASLTAYAQDEACAPLLCSRDFYDWQGLTAVTTEDFAALRFIEEQGVLEELE
ncbi:MAG TPA: PhnD/SsuA/transferrin family substrate-binding protein [Anaerolineae bacterium]|nr:PhnD/SsuA/transferrin family substrate-binding protein [Anaerolineae bacterium]